MKATILISYILSIILMTAKAQCPTGYELRNVKCLNSSSLSQKCIPANYTCNSCWVIEWPKCNSDEKGGYHNPSSYEDALNVQVRCWCSCRRFERLAITNNSIDKAIQ